MENFPVNITQAADRGLWVLVEFADLESRKRFGESEISIFCEKDLLIFSKKGQNLINNCNLNIDPADLRIMIYISPVLKADATNIPTKLRVQYKNESKDFKIDWRTIQEKEDKTWENFAEMVKKKQELRI